MTDQGADDGLEQQIIRLIEAMKKYGVVGGTIGPDGVSTGMPNWEERTKDQRFAQKVRTHGYPLGLAKSTLSMEARLVAKLKYEVITMNADERTAFNAAFEALAHAIDAQRFLGNYNPRDRHSFDMDLVDTIAWNIMAWLRERGHRIVRIDDGADEEPLLDDDTIAKLSDMPWLEAGCDAGARLDQHLKNWRGERHSQRKYVNGSLRFNFVPTKLYRQGLIERYRGKLASLHGEDRAAYRAAHEALAYAVDAELFLRSVPDVDLEVDAMEEAVNRFTNRVLAWLDDRGYELVPKANIH